MNSMLLLEVVQSKLDSHGQTEGRRARWAHIALFVPVRGGHPAEGAVALDMDLHITEPSAARAEDTDVSCAHMGAQPPLRPPNAVSSPLPQAHSPCVPGLYQNSMRKGILGHSFSSSEVTQYKVIIVEPQTKLVSVDHKALTHQEILARPFPSMGR